MPNISMPILFFGTEDFSAVALEGLLAAGFDVRAVITKPDSKKGRGQRLSPPLVKTIAQKYGVAVWQPTKLSEVADDIIALQPVAGVLVSYGRIVPRTIIELFTPGIINLHPSLLPKYRGPSPIESALLHGDESTGVSLMQLSPKMDAGPVYHQVEYHLPQYETKPHLYKKLAELGTSELVAALPRILDGSLQATLQNEATASYCPLLNKSDGLLDPARQTADEAERNVRAFLGFPRSRLSLRGHEVIITKAHVSQQGDEPGAVAFQDGAYLVIDELIAPSGRRMSADAFEKGYRH